MPVRQDEFEIGFKKTRQASDIPNAVGRENPATRHLLDQIASRFDQGSFRCLRSTAGKPPCLACNTFVSGRISLQVCLGIVNDGDPLLVEYQLMVWRVHPMTFFGRQPAPTAPEVQVVHDLRLRLEQILTHHFGAVDVHAKSLTATA